MLQDNQYELGNSACLGKEPSPRGILVFLVNAYGLSAAVPVPVVKQAPVLRAGIELVFLTL